MAVLEPVLETVALGRTGLKATVAGLGCGGFSRVGIGQYGEAHAAKIVRAAYDAGVNFFDTATVYGTEGAVGLGLEGVPRDRYILSTKAPSRTGEGAAARPSTAQEILGHLEQSLRLLKTDYVDIWHLHGLSAKDYPHARDELLPAMKKAQEQGKIRFIGTTEAFAGDPQHKMFELALPDDPFDVIMVGYNLLNPSAATRVLPWTIKHNVGVLCMFAVRKALHDPAQLRTDIGRILAAGQADPAVLRADEDLSFLTRPSDGMGEGASGAMPAASTVMEAAYRFCRHTPGIHVVLTGTGNPAHLADNLRSIAMPPLPQGALERLSALFGRVDCVSGQ